MFLFVCLCLAASSIRDCCYLLFRHEYWRAGSWITGAYYFCSTCSFFCIFLFTFFFFHSISLPPPHRFFLIFVFLRLIVLSLVAAALIAHLYVYTHTQKVHTHTCTHFNQYSSSFFFYCLIGLFICIYLLFLFISCCCVYLFWCGECFLTEWEITKGCLSLTQLLKTPFYPPKKKIITTHVFFFSLCVYVCVCVTFASVLA